MSRPCFPRTARVRARADFLRVFQHGRRVALPLMTLHWQAVPAEQSEVIVSVGIGGTGETVEPAPISTPGESLHAAALCPRVPRLGLAVSRKVDPHAVGRNRIKRVLRDSFRHYRALLRPGDYVVVVRAGASQCSGEQLREAFLSLLQRAGALPPGARGGTMPAATSLPSPP